MPTSKSTLLIKFNNNSFQIPLSKFAFQYFLKHYFRFRNERKSSSVLQKRKKSLPIDTKFLFVQRAIFFNLEKIFKKVFCSYSFAPFFTWDNPKCITWVQSNKLVYLDCLPILSALDFHEGNSPYRPKSSTRTIAFNPTTKKPIFQQ